MTPLRQRMMEDMQIRDFSPNTIGSYIFQVAQFAKHFKKSPEVLGAAEAWEYQLFLLKRKFTPDGLAVRRWDEGG